MTVEQCPCGSGTPTPGDILGASVMARPRSLLNPSLVLIAGALCAPAEGAQEGVNFRITLTEPGMPSAAGELARFASTPRAIQAIMRGTGVGVARFKPSVPVTLWS